MSRKTDSARRTCAFGGGVEVTAPVEVGPTFFGWLFQLGAQAELIGPAAVRQELRDYCAAVLAKYE